MRLLSREQSLPASPGRLCAISALFLHQSLTTIRDVQQPSRKRAKLAAGLGLTGDAAATAAALWLAPQVGAIGEFAAAVLLLMAETAAGAASLFAPAIAALPATHHCVMAWSPAETAMLRGTAVGDELPDTRAFFEDKVVPVAAHRRDLWPEGAWCAAL